MKVDKLINNAIENLGIERTVVCYEGKHENIIKEFIPDSNHKLDLLNVDNMTFQGFIDYFKFFNEKNLLIMFIPFNVLDVNYNKIYTFEDKIHNVLMDMERKGVYFINIFLGRDGFHFNQKTQELYNRLLIDVVKKSSVEAIMKNSKKYTDIFSVGKKFNLTDDNGTDIDFIVEKILNENAPLSPDNRIIQIPHGEIVIVPKRGSINGKLAIEDGKDVFVTDVINDSIKLNTSKVKGTYPIAELGFGTNPNIPSIKVLPYIVKKFNTYHLGIGDNSNLGGTYKLSYHFDIVISEINWYLTEYI